jgi:hypothetical protein
MARTFYSSDDLTADEAVVLGTLAPGAHDTVRGIIFSDVAGALTIEQSIDGGVNWDLTESQAVAAGAGEVIDEVVFGNLFQFTWTPEETSAEFRFAVSSTSAGPRP